MDRRAALALTVASAALWGTSFPANDLGVHATDPLTFMLARFGLAALFTGALAVALRSLDPSWLRNKWVWATAGANAVSYQLQFFGQQLTTPGAASLMVNAGNLAIPFLAYAVLGERVRGAKVPALLLAAAGVVLVGTRGDPAALASGSFLGDALTLAAGVSFALVIVLNKAALEQRPDGGPRAALAMTTWVIGLTALLAVPGALLLGSHALPPRALAAAAYTGFFTTTLAFTLWTFSLRWVSSVVSGLVLLLEIVVAFALSVALGLEVPTLATLAGAGCILAAVALVSLPAATRD